MLATLSSLPLTSFMANRSSTTQASVLHSRRRGRLATDSLAWIFRTNLPPRKGTPLLPIEKRNFFGFGDVLSVLTKPAETLRSLMQAREALEKAHLELQQQTAQLPTSYLYCFGTPKPLPSSSECSFPRPAELNALRRILNGPPAFTILCGASSVGKTALLREVLCDEEKHHVLRLDLRIASAGIADLEGLYSRLSGELQAFFGNLSETIGKQEVLFKEVRADKYDKVKPSDVALLMERFRNALLRYHCASGPSLSPKGTMPEKIGEDRDALSDEETRVGHVHEHKTRNEGSGESTLERSAEKAIVLSEPSGNEAEELKEENDKGEKTDDRAEKPTTSGLRFRPPKPMPVIVFDDAHKLPELVRSSEMQEAMQSLLDAMLVLSKQDDLCHVVHVANDGFYIDWLRRIGVVEPCKIVTISDFPKAETRQYFIQRLLSSVPATLRSRLDKDMIFEKLFDSFGGRIAHWTDFVLCDWVNAGGNLPIERSTHFLQAYTLLNLQILHASESDFDALQDDNYEQQTDHEREQHYRQGGCHHCGAVPGPDNLCSRPKLRSRRWSGWSWCRMKDQASRTHLPTGSKGREGGDKPAFTSMQLLDVMHRLSSSSSRFSATHQGRPNMSTDTMHGGIGTITDTVTGIGAGRGLKTFAKDGGGGAFIGYFFLCREIGRRAVDDMVRTGILELRWSEAIQPSSGSSLRNMFDHSHSAVSDNGVEQGGGKSVRLGPTLHPISPIMAYAMRVVLDEYGYQPADDALEEEEEHGEEMEEEYEDDFPEGGRDGRRGYDRYEEESAGGQGHGRESSNLSDDQSDYVSLSDVSEY